MNLFDYEEYKDFLKDRLKGISKGGRGEWGKLAKSISIHSTRLSHIIRGHENFTPEQAVQVANYLGLNPIETEFFLTLVHYSRSGTQELRTILKKQIDQLRHKSSDLVNRVQQDKILPEHAKAVFYSQWFYSGVRLLTSIPGLNNVDTVSDYFGLPKKTVSEVLEFLVFAGLCEKIQGKIQMGPARTHIESESLLVGRHHTNWRLKAIEKFNALNNVDELAYTAPMSINRSDGPVIREKLLKVIEEVNKVASASEADHLHCLNIDWFNF